MRWLVLVLLLVIGTTAALGLPNAPTSIGVLSTGSRQFSNVSNSTVNAQGGNVTQLQIDALTITKSWQGYYGNITGNIHLDDANNNSFYLWGNGTTLSGEIYATRNSSPDWTSVNCSNATQRLLEDVYLGLNASDGDSVINTFNQTSHPLFYVGTRLMNANSCFSTYGLVNGTTQNSSFSQILPADVTNNTIYTTMVENDRYGFNFQRMDFQLMVGENEHIGSEGVTEYFFFTEIN